MTELLAIDGGAPVRTAPLDYRKGASLLGEEEREALLEVLDSRSLFRYYGPDLRHKVDGFERTVTELLGCRYATATSSGTAALRAGLAALGIGPGDEVIVPAFTFIATVNAVVIAGAVPVFAEVDTALGIDPAHVDALANERTAAVIPVHLENAACDLDGLLAVARRRGLRVLEDACQSMGATYRGRALGTVGDLGAVSLQLEKNITTGEGGVVVTDDEGLHLRAARYTDQGGQFVTSRHGMRGGEGEHAFVGENLRMNELSGAVAGAQARRLPAILSAMRHNRRAVLDRVGAIDGLELRASHDQEGDGGSSITWFLPSAELAARFVDALNAEGIPSARLYAGLPVYANPAILEQRVAAGPGRGPWATHPVPVHYAMGMCPRTEDLAARAAAVAIGPGYTEQDCADVAAAVGKVAGTLLGG